MQRNLPGAVMLLAALTLGVAACEGRNSFPDEPVGPGDTSTGSIRGQVTANGTGLRGAQVAVVNGATAQTDSAGQYRIAGLTPGTYRVSLLAPVGLTLVPGDSATRTAVVVAGASVVVDWRLQGTVGGGTGGTGTGTGS